MEDHNKLLKHSVKLHNSRYTDEKNECMETFIAKII